MRIGADNPRPSLRARGRRLLTRDSNFDQRRGEKRRGVRAVLFVREARTGGEAYDSSTGFAIGPNLRVYAPDASWVSQSGIDARKGSLDEEGFWPSSPAVALEVKLRTDDGRVTVARIHTVIERGSSYAVAINPDTREVVPSGTPPPGLALDFDAIIDA